MYGPGSMSARKMADQNEKNLPIPMALRVLVKGREHYWEYRLDIIAYQIAEVFIVPEIKGSLGNLTLKSVVPLKVAR
jgi:hypothetical protein